MFSKPHTFRSKKYLAFIRSQPCLLCGNPETVAHHEALGKNYMGGNPPDSQAIPLCNDCHVPIRHDQWTKAFWEDRHIDIKMEIMGYLTKYLESC